MASEKRAPPTIPAPPPWPSSEHFIERYEEEEPRATEPPPTPPEPRGEKTGIELVTDSGSTGAEKSSSSPPER